MLTEIFIMKSIFLLMHGKDRHLTSLGEPGIENTLC